VVDLISYFSLAWT